MSDVEQLEQQLKSAKEGIARRDMALKLSSNREFRKLILDDFIVTEVSRLMGVAGDPSVSKEDREIANDMAKAGGHLKRFLSVTVQRGALFDRDVVDLEIELAEARGETVEQPEQAADVDHAEGYLQ